MIVYMYFVEINKHVHTYVVVRQATFVYMFTWSNNCVFLLAGHDDFNYALKCDVYILLTIIYVVICFLI